MTAVMRNNTKPLTYPKIPDHTSIAVAAGVPKKLISEVASFMRTRGEISVSSAHDYLLAHDFYSTQAIYRSGKKPTYPPSTLSVMLDVEGFHIHLNVAFETISLPGDVPKQSFHLLIKDGILSDPIQNILFGEQKDGEWFRKIFGLLQSARIPNKGVQKKTLLCTVKMKLVTMLMNLLVYRLIKMHPQETTLFVEAILGRTFDPLLVAHQRPDIETLRLGLPLLYSLWTVFENQVDNHVTVQLQADALKEEQLRVFHYCTKSIQSHVAPTLKELMRVHARRWQVTMFLLCDLPLVPPELVTPRSLHFLFRLGHYLEWEGTVAHDLGKWSRDAALGETNCFLFWLAQRGAGVDDVGVVEEFLGVVESIHWKKRQKLMKEKDVVLFLDLESFFRTSIPVVQKFYGVAELMGSPAML